MLSFFKNLFSSSKEQEITRVLSHPSHLRTGDIIKFKLLDQTELSGIQFEVSQINTYIYGDICYPELILKDNSNNVFYLMTEEEDGEEYLAISKKVGRGSVSEILNQSQIDEIRERGTGTKVNISQKPSGFDQWLVRNYKEVDDSVEGSFIKGDARYLSDEQISKREHFLSHTLLSDDEEFALELEFYKTGEVELSATIYLEIDQIEEMWPAN